MKMLIYSFFIAVGIILMSGVATWNGGQEDAVPASEPISTENTLSFEENLTPVDSFDHSHGLALDPNDPTRLYIATHDGLLLLREDKSLYEVGNADADYMGFSAHPTDSDVLFTSGHPATGGNLGVQKSTDGGVTWTKISAGADGPVDFHAMAISPANPDLLYGWYMERLQRSTDGGVTWEWVETDLEYTMLFVAHPTDENTVYAMTFGGPKVSQDQGETWTSFLGEDSAVQMLSLAIDPQNPNRMISYSNTWGLAVSEDGGASWTSLEEDLGGEAALFLVIAPQDPKTIYALTNQNHLYKTSDGGSIWNQIL